MKLKEKNKVGKVELFFKVGALPSRPLNYLK
jgi:hypothetical protein